MLISNRWKIHLRALVDAIFYRHPLEREQKKKDIELKEEDNRVVDRIYINFFRPESLFCSSAAQESQRNANSSAAAAQQPITRK